jgi:predicted DNA-binding protein
MYQEHVSSPEDKVVQVSITMSKELKERYSKLALELDLCFSQLVRFALRRVHAGVMDLKSLEKLRDRKPEDKI